MTTCAKMPTCSGESPGGQCAAYGRHDDVSRVQARAAPKSSADPSPEVTWLYEQLLEADENDNASVLSMAHHTLQPAGVSLECPRRTNGRPRRVIGMLARTARWDSWCARHLGLIWLVDALIGATRRLIDVGEAQWGVWFARMALSHDNLREDACMALMKAQVASAQRTAP